MRVFYDGVRELEKVDNDIVSQYLFYRAGLRSKNYAARLFIQMLEGVDFSEFGENEQRKEAADIRRESFITEARKCIGTVTVEDFVLDKEEIKRFVKGS